MKTAGVVMIGTISHLLGGFDLLLKTILILIVLDYLTGTLSAVYNKKLSSSIGFKGILKKFMIILLIILSTALNGVIESMPIREIMIMFFIANEGISIIENAVNLDLPIPKKIIKMLKQIQEESI